MSEMQNTYLENLHTTQESIPGLDQEKYDVLKDYTNFSTFEALLKTNFENKDVLLQLLNKISKFKLKIYFKNGFTLIDQKGMDEFINDPQFSSVIEQQQNEEKEQQNEEKEQQNEEKEQQNEEKEQQNEEKEQKTLLNSENIQKREQTTEEKLKTFTDKYPLFKDGLTKYAQNNDKVLLELLQKFETSYDNTDIDAFLTYFNSNPQKLEEIFSSLQTDEKSYKAFYSFLESSGDPNLLSRLQTIPKDPKDFTKQENRLDKLLDTSPYFPNTNPGDIKKVGNILTTQIDEKKGYNKVIETGELPPSSYIEGKNGYRIKTDIISPRLLDIRGAFTNEKLRIEGQKQNLENKLSSLNSDNIENTQNQIETQIEDLQNKQENPGLSFEEEIQLEGLQKDLQEIENLLQKREELQNQIQKLDTELTQREDEFLKYYTKEMGNSSESIQNKDEQAKDTLNFLNSIGVTHIPFSDFLRLQNLINQNQTSLGLSKPLDINKGFTKSDSIDETKNSDREFLRVWSKIIGQENNLTPETTRGGNMGDRFSGNSFGESLKQSGVLTESGRLNFVEVEKRMGEGE